MRGLTGHQNNIVRQVGQCLQQTRFLTVADLVRRLHLAGESSLVPTLESIQRKGYLSIHRLGKGQNRFIELTPLGQSLLQGGLPRQGVPLLGTIPAGPLTEAVQQALDYVDPGNALRWRPGDFLLQVDPENGDSMHDAGIRPGDLVLLRPDAPVDSGHIVAALVWTPERDSCQSTLKRVLFKPGQRTVTLQAANPAYPPLVVPARQITFAGVYQGLLRPQA